MSEKKFDNEIADAQATDAAPVAPEAFDFDGYAEHESSLLERCGSFWVAESAVAVYRRMRVAEVFSCGCKDKEKSLGWQLGGLQKSIEFKADIPNFLEPWYGIGTVASAFGVDYEWAGGQAPAVKAAFQTVDDALIQDVVPVEQTPIGKHTLEMIEYFLDKTEGKIPICLTDTQSPMDTASFLVESNNFFMSFFDNPEGLKKLLGVITNLLLDFTKKQVELIGDALVKPGHGFASSRSFSGLGMSDDVMTMISDKQYVEFEAPCMTKTGEPFGGAAFHSCGNWSGKIDAVKKIKNLVMVDGAFSAQTDPAPNPAEPFADAFAGTNIVVNARMVGEGDVVIDKVKQLWKPGMKLIAVTYCRTPEEQAEAYDRIHEICKT